MTIEAVGLWRVCCLCTRRLRGLVLPLVDADGETVGIVHARCHPNERRS